MSPPTLVGKSFCAALLTDRLWHPRSLGDARNCYAFVKPKSTKIVDMHNLIAHTHRKLIAPPLGGGHFLLH